MQKPKAEVKALKAEGEGKGSRKRQQHKGKRHFLTGRGGKVQGMGANSRAGWAIPSTVITLCYALRQNEKGRRKTSKDKCRMQRQKERQRQTGKGKCRMQSMKAEDKDRR